MFGGELEANKCIAALQKCHAVCMRTLSYSGNQIEREYHTHEELRKSMLDCAEMCQAAANFLIRDSDHYLRICREASEICKDLASISKVIDRMEGVISKCNECIHACRVIVG